MNVRLQALSVAKRVNPDWIRSDIASVQARFLHRCELIVGPVEGLDEEHRAAWAMICLDSRDSEDIETVFLNDDWLIVLQNCLL